MDRGCNTMGIWGRRGREAGETMDDDVDAWVYRGIIGNFVHIWDLIYSMQGLALAEAISHARVAQAPGRPRLKSTLPTKVTRARARAGTTARARTKARAKVGRAKAMGSTLIAAHHGSKAKLSVLL